MDQILAIIRRHWLPLLALNSALIAATIYIATIYANKTPPVWTASAKLNLPQTGNLSADLGTLGNLENKGISFSKEVSPLAIQSAILTSDVVLERVRAIDPEKDLYSSVGSYRRLFEVSPQELSTIMLLEVEGSSPELARSRAATVIEVYQKRLNELRQNDSNSREQFARADLVDSRKKLIQAQKALTQFQGATGIVDRDAQTKGLVEAINNLKDNQATVLAEARSNQTQAQAVAARLGTTPQQAMNSLSLSENKEYQAIREEVSLVETALAQARGKFTEQSPQVQSLLLQRQELRRDLDQRLRTAIPGVKAETVDITLGGGNGKDSRVEMISKMIETQTLAQGLQQQANQLKNQEAKLTSELRYISENQGYLLDLQRQYEIAEGVHNGIIAQIEQAKTTAFNAYPNVQTIDEPISGTKPTVPKRWLVLLGGTLASFFGSAALLLFLESRKPLLSPKDLQQVDFPLLGSIPKLKRPDMERRLEADVEIEFQRLASAVSSLMQDNDRLMVASSMYGEGKTTVTLGLALALAKLGFRVLVVDGDLRRADLSQRLGHPQAKIGNAKAMPIPVYRGLDLLSAPAIAEDKIAEFFAQGHFEQQLSAIQDSNKYDYVLVDSAPLSLTIEPALMSAVVPNVLFVVRPGISDRYSVADGFEQLIRGSARITGLVVNGVDSRTEGYRYGRQRELLTAEA